MTVTALYVTCFLCFLVCCLVRHSCSCFTSRHQLSNCTMNAARLMCRGARWTGTCQHTLYFSKMSCDRPCAITSATKGISGLF